MLLRFLTLIVLIWVPRTLADPGDCLEMDSKPPKCADYVDAVTKEPVFIVHAFNCSRFWVCEPDQAACLFECAKASEDGALYFDVRIQYPEGPVCDWPAVIDCEMGDEPECLKDEDCLETEYCADDSKCKVGCRDDSTCVPCGECKSHVCTTPECCSDADCEDNEYCSAEQICEFGCNQDDDCVDCATCDNHKCTEPECCEDNDCTAMTCSTCTLNSFECMNPECCTDADCKENFFCSASQICEPGCTDDSDCKDCAICESNQCTEPECCANEDCTAMTCSTCNLDSFECINPDCCSDADCLDTEYCSDAGTCLPGCNENSDCTTMSCSSCDLNAMQCIDPDCCYDEDCASTEYCTDALICEDGCKTNADCGGCATCEDHVCTDPECCVDADCMDPEKPICAEDNLCVAGCRNDEMCPGFDVICTPMYDNCNWCDSENNEVGQCNPGCIDDDNCAGSLECNGVHECIQADGVTVLKQIVLNTESCNGCQGTAVEDGPILEIIGGQIVSGVTECKTNALDHEDMIDFAPGNEAVFEGETDKDVLGSCYKASLISEVTGGKIIWTASVGEWSLANNRVDFYWSDENACPYSCCLSEPVLSVTSNTADLVNCSRNCGNSVQC
ncbi:protein psiQ isoform X2 [Eurytemora carolleeae]|nr:protein psiQ isoform X2 [Eurytemora carolleeae]|eukprot:XP_023348280.1 protein psiQ-like isoform X2 [Eurytemora affinis]